MTQALRAVCFIGVLSLAARGYDFLSGPHTVDIARLHEFIPPVVWGLSCVVAAVLLLVSLWRSNPRWVVFGCIVAFSVEAMLGVMAVPVTFLDSPFDNSQGLIGHWFASGVWSVVGLTVAFRHGVAKILIERQETGSGLD